MKTPETRFSYIPSLDADLFAVRAGIPLATAAEEAGCIVDAVLGTVRRVACSISIDDGAHLLLSAAYSLDMAHGLLGSIQAALEDREPSAPADGFGYYIAPSDNTAPGPFQWFVVNHANDCVVEYGTADTWSDADQVACDTIKRLEKQAAPAPAPEAKPEDPETMRQVWRDMAKMAADELAKLDRAGAEQEARP
jgi:hypothetical protein